MRDSLMRVCDVNWTCRACPSHVHALADRSMFHLILYYYFIFLSRLQLRQL